jgi:hypothetical protein
MMVQELIGKRVLATDPKVYGTTSVVELKIVEVSPSGNWVKVMNAHGNQFWRATAQLVVVEVLTVPESKPTT